MAAVTSYPSQRGSTAVFDPAALRLPRFDVSDSDGPVKMPADRERPWPAVPPLFKPAASTGVDGRSTSLLVEVDQLYQPASLSVSTRDKNRPPSRAGSIYGGSALYQPLMQTPHNSVWGNSALFRNSRPPSDPGSANPAPPSSGWSPVGAELRNVSAPQFGGNGFAAEPSPPTIAGLGGAEKRLPAEPIVFPAKSIKLTTDQKIFLRLCAIQIALGLVLFSTGVARLILSSPKTLGLELVYGVYVVVSGIIGVLGSRRSDWRLLTACCIMTVLSCVLCIPPFVVGLLFTVPDTRTTLQKLDPQLFRSDLLPYGLDAFLSAVCLSQWVVSVVTLIRACSAIGRFARRMHRALENLEDEGEKTTEKRSDLSSAMQKAALKI